MLSESGEHGLVNIYGDRVCLHKYKCYCIYEGGCVKLYSKAFYVHFVITGSEANEHLRHISGGAIKDNSEISVLREDIWIRLSYWISAVSIIS